MLGLTRTIWQMVSHKRFLARSLGPFAGFLFATSLHPIAARAQVAPTGDHYGARASDTGFTGAVNSSGGFGASVPLDLPSVRGNLPLPLHVSYGGHRFGAAGLGWDVPLSFIRRDQTVAHRRPAGSPGVGPQAREQLSLTLDGQGMDLVRNAANTAWLARRDGAQLEVRDLGGGVLEMYDGNGLKYSFSSDGGSVGLLDSGNLYLLRDISGPGGTNVHLEYGFGAPALPGGGTGLSIDLVSVRYNPDVATGACAKHQVNLVYDGALTTPLSMQPFGSTVLARMHKLRVIDVTARTNSTDHTHPCIGAIKSLRRYDFIYQNDADTGQRQLQRVTMVGQEGTAERDVELPVETHTYGQVTDASDRFSYRITARLIRSQLPDEFDTGFALASTGGSPGPGDTAATTFSTLQNFVDVNGDGRVDLVYHKRLSVFGSLFGVALNAPSLVRGGMVFTPLDRTLDTVAPPFGFENIEDHTSPRMIGNGNANVANRWSETIDFNGDGRLDVVVANEVLNAWVVYLNKPDPQDSRRIAWVRREIDVRPFLQYVPDFFLLQDFENSNGQIYLPLSRTHTGHDRWYNHCWKWDAGAMTWSENIDGFFGPRENRCNLPQGQDPGRDDFASTDFPSKTITEWELRDINGDGYPDFVYNASPVAFHTFDAPQPEHPGVFPGQFVETQEAVLEDIRGRRDVLALLNVAGVHLEMGTDEPSDLNDDSGLPLSRLHDGTSAFSAPITLEVSANITGDCGVSRWIDSKGALTDGVSITSSIQVCGFGDVNGDGLTDRLTTLAAQRLGARLGTGNPNAPFSGATIDLPGPIARADVNEVLKDDSGEGHFKPEACPDEPSGDSTFPFPPNDTYPIRRTAGLRDINADGILDYVAFDRSAHSWTAALGTGVGFAASKPLDAERDGFDRFELSLEKVGCFSNNTTGGTTEGLFDIDGDGQPEAVELDNDGLNIYKLNTFRDRLGGTQANPPTSGRLITIANGYGALKNIDYRSAKEDASTEHQLPYPELVVAQISTTDTSGNLLSSPIVYAYGGASQIFDAAHDRFVFPGYQRRVTLQNTDLQGPTPTEGMASIADTYPLPIFDEGLDARERFLRYLKAGRTRDATTLSGNVGTDPWALLTADVSQDTRRIAGTHSDWSGRLLPVGLTGNESCVDMVDPYDFSRSLAYRNDVTHESFDQCAEHGFALQIGVASFRGTPGTDPGTADVITSPQTLRTSSAVNTFDDFGRVTSSVEHNDLTDNGDDLCIFTDYATPTPNTTVRVLNAPAKRTVSGCTDSSVVLAQERWVYDALTDDLPTVRVSNGFVTDHEVTRYDMDAHASLGEVGGFNAKYTPAGNLDSIFTVRDEDGANRNDSFAYDDFGLVQTLVSTFAQPPGVGLSESASYDPVTLNLKTATDPDQTVRSYSYDGFGRLLLSKIKPPGGSEGVLASLAYNGFQAGSTGRTIVQKVFTDPVPEANVGTAASRTGTTFLDALGRTTKTEAQLGASYQNKILIVGQRSYDPLGRVRFMADPFLSTGDFATAYGTTQHFFTDGTAECFIRGSGTQPVTAAVDETNEIYPTCFSRSYANSQEILAQTNADALLTNSPQAFVSRQTIRNAIGRELERRTVSDPDGSTVLEDMTFGYDALGHMTRMTRYQDPATWAIPLTTAWHYDSLGWMTKLEEPGVAPQTRTFDSWGEVTQVQWCDDRSQAPCPTKDRRTITRFDALGRVAHSEAQTNGAVNPETVNDYTYDVGVNNTTPPVTATNVLGRLAIATSPTSKVSFSYDAFGRVKAKVFTDTTLTRNNVYVEKHDIHGDGSEQTLHLLLPDNAFKDEKVAYDYDSAGRVRSVKYNDGTNRDLFTASGTLPIYDVFGRITTAQYGLATFDATYADTGRRLLSDVQVIAGGRSREISFEPSSALGVSHPYDPLGRERVRQEFKDGTTSGGGTRTYDELGRLAQTMVLVPAGTTTGLFAERTFTYDPIGNVLTQDDGSEGHAASVSLTYKNPDPDRICSVAYGSATPPAACNLTYDGAGNILSEPTRSGTRTFSYFPNGQVKTIVNGSTNATFKYDAFGAVQQLTLNTPQADKRSDKHFGGLIMQRAEGGNSVVTRAIPAPGLVATRHGPTGGWTFAFGEGRGTRFVTDQAGAFVQDVDYRPYGEVKDPTGAQPHTTNYTSAQWNDGDFLAALGVVQLGARIYDPVIGRFVSRDPLLIPRTAATTNPYAFAMNDPINGSDPSGLDPTPCDGIENGAGNCDDGSVINVDGGHWDWRDHPETWAAAGIDMSWEEWGVGAEDVAVATWAANHPAVTGSQGPTDGERAERFRSRFFPVISDRLPGGRVKAYGEMTLLETANQWATLTAGQESPSLVGDAAYAAVTLLLGDDDYSANSAGSSRSPGRLFPLPPLRDFPSGDLPGDEFGYEVNGKTVGGIKVSMKGGTMKVESYHIYEEYQGSGYSTEMLRSVVNQLDPSGTKINAITGVLIDTNEAAFGAAQGTRSQRGQATPLGHSLKSIGFPEIDVKPSRSGLMRLRGRR